jgi:MFS family permease
MVSQRAALATTFVFACGLMGLAGLIAAPSSERPVIALMTPSFLVAPVVGGLILVRQPQNRVGWLFCFIGLGIAATLGLGIIADGASSLHPALAVVGGWIGQWAYLIFVVPAGLLFLTFPDGRLPSRGWRLPAIAFLACALLAGAGAAFGRTATSVGEEHLPNPFAAPETVRPVLIALGDAGATALGLALIPAAAAVAFRLRRARGVERQQLKWFAFAVLASLGVALTLGVLPSPFADWSFGAAVIGFGAAVPAAAGLAILRYRLYDIDVVIRRTLVYGVVIAILGATYVALVLGLQALLSGLTGGETIPVALSTLAIAALFGPLRRRVRDGVDRSFYRSRYDAQRILDTFAVQMRDEVALDAVSALLTETAGRAVRPASAGIWIR